MARGKNAAKSANRRSAALRAQRDALLAEIAAEQATIEEVTREDVRLASIAEDLDQALKARDSFVAKDISRLRAETDYLAHVLAEAKATHDHLHDRWERYIERGVARCGGGADGMEKFFGIIMRRGVNITEGGHHGALAESRIARARGERSSEVANLTLSTYLRPIFSNDVLALRDNAGVPEDALIDDDLPPEQRAALLACEKRAIEIDGANVYKVDREVIHTNYPSPYIETDPVWTGEGATGEHGGSGGHWCTLLGETDAIPTIEDTSPAPPMRPTSQDLDIPTHTVALSATVRAKAASAGPVRLISAWQPSLSATARLAAHTMPGYPMTGRAPLYPTSGCALAYRHAYSLSAFGMWSRRVDSHAPEGPWGQVAVGLATAATFWLPEGQTRAFVDSEPLDAESLSELHLPYAQVFVALAEPLILDAVHTPTLDEAQLDALAHVHDSTNKPLWGKSRTAPRSRNVSLAEIRSAANDIDVNQRQTTGQVLDAFGGRIEGVLFLGDALGRLAETFAWCVALNGPGGDGTLARVVIPATWANTHYRDQALNLAAVAAWADWHAPDVSTGAMTGDMTERELDEASREGAGVHVLNVRATGHRSTEAADPGASGKQVAPHLRRGHWRRQRHGVGRSQVKMVRIAPVAVNAHLGETRASVYRLPTNPKNHA